MKQTENELNLGKFTKRPVTIEAFQMTQKRRWDNSEWPHWLNMAWQHGAGEGGVWIDPDMPPQPHGSTIDDLICGTLEGVYKITFDDWIIKGIEGEIYPCKPDIFEKTYTRTPALLVKYSEEGEK